jgi:hypothetical protein
LHLELLESRIVLTLDFGAALTTPFALSGSVLGATGDLNSDGLTDLTLLNTNHTVSTLLGHGDGTFRVAATLPTGASPSHSALADFDGDGKLDVATSDAAGDSISVLLGNGDGTFGLASILPAADYAFGITAGYFNEDAHIDLATSNFFGDSVAVFVGHGNGNFEDAVPYAAGNGASNVESADVNGDGDLDLVTANSDENSVSILLGGEDATFQPPIPLAAESYTYDLVAVDLDGDTDMDLAAVNYSSASLSVFINQGGGVFSPAVSTPIGSNPNAIRSGDFNNDGLMDLAMSCYGSGAMVVLEGKGNGTFEDPLFLPLSGVQGVAAADFDGNGTTDLAGVTTGSDVTVWLSQSVPANPHLVLDAPTDIPIGTPLTITVTALDANNSVITDFTGTVHFRSSDRHAILPADYTFSPTDNGVHQFVATLNSGDVQTLTATLTSAPSIVGGAAVTVHLPTVDFGGPTSLTADSGPTDVAEGDFNGDNIPDIAVSEWYAHGIRVFRGNGDGTFSQSQDFYATGSNPYSVVARDLDGDQRLDLVVVNTTGYSISVLLGNGNGTFRPAVSYATGSEPYRVAIGYVDDDDELDLVTSDYASGAVSVFIGNGGGTFQAAKPFDAGAGATGVAIGDFNGDNKQDLVTANLLAGTMSILLGDGNGEFLDPVPYASGTYPARVAVGDFNEDGKHDVAVANFGSNNVAIFRGNGDGTFQGAVNYAVGVNPNSLRLIDLNLDGNSDLVVANSGSNSVSFLAGNGNGTFQPEATFATGVGPYAVTIADWDGNGTADLATADFYGNTVSVISNLAAPASPHLVISAPASAAHGAPFGVTVSVLDSENNVLTGFTGTVHVGSSDVTAGLPTDYTFTAADEGVHVFSVTLNIGSSQTVSASLVGTSGIVTGQVVALTVPEVDFAPAFYLTDEPVNGGLSVVTADFDLDGNVDLAIGDHSAPYIYVYPGSGTGSFGAPVPYAIGGSVAYFLVAAHLNDDAYIDLAVVTYTSRSIDVLANSPTGFTLVASIGFIPTHHPSGLVAVDFDNDGDQDLVASGTYTPGGQMSGLLSVVRNNGSNDFELINYVVNGNWPTDVTAGDVDENGTQDLVTADFHSATVSVLTGDLSGGFTRVHQFGLPTDPHGIALRDLNHDGHLDIVAGMHGSLYGFVNAIRVYRGLGNGDFMPGVDYSTDGAPVDITIADVNDDGHPDILIPTILGQSLNVFLNYGDGTFTPKASFASGGYSHQSAVADFDEDGDLDVAVANNSAGLPISILMNLMIANNLPPSADAGGPYTLAEGNSLILDASSSTDPDLDSLTYSWDVNGDGEFDDIFGVSPTLEWGDLILLGIEDGPAAFNVRVQVNDGNGHTVFSVPTLLTVNNVAPVASIAGPASGVRYQARTFTFGASDFSPVDQSGAFIYHIDWDGDGIVDESVTGTSVENVSHTYTALGTYTVHVSAEDKDGGLSSTVSQSITIGVTDSQGGELAIGGTASDDTFIFSPGASVGDVVAILNGTTLPTFPATTAVLIFAGPGSDAVTVRGNGSANSFESFLSEVRYNGLPFTGESVEAWAAEGLGGSDTFSYHEGTITLNGGTGADELLAASSVSHTWNINAMNGGNLNGAANFSAMERLTGGASDDAFVFAPAGSVGGPINGNSGHDTLNYSALSTNVSVSLRAGTATKTGGFAEFESYIGGGGTDTLIAFNTVNTWTVAGNGSGEINGTFAFAAVENLTGGTASDTFVFLADGSIVGTVNGGGGSDTLDYGSYGSPVQVDLLSRTSNALGAFVSISALAGSTMIDTLIGDNANRTWSLTGNDAGMVGTFSFTSFEALAGGDGNDTFRFTAAGNISTQISGGGGINELDYAAWSSPATVNLMTGTASAAGGVTDIHDVTGGTADDLLIGNALDNMLAGGGGDDLLLGGGGADDLRGGGGRDLIFAGSGSDRIDGGAADDLLLGGRITYFDEATGTLDAPALTAIRNEWKRTNLDYNGRVFNLSNGGGLNGTSVLNSSTVLDDGAVDTLFGRAALDWFLIGLGDAIQDLNTGGAETVTTI